MSKASNRIQVMIDDELYEAVKQAASDEDRTVSDYVRVLLKSHLLK